jgi:ribosomal protein S27E
MENKVENKQEREQFNILAVSGSAFMVTPPNVVLDCGNAKIVFDKQQIQVDDMLDIYIKLKNYLNTFKGVYL